jgi:metallo-beta-lactamase class B
MFCFNSAMLRPAALLFALLLAFGSRALTPEETRWNQPVPPFRIAGNLYYVGVYDLTSFAIRTEKGLILLDSGFAETVPLIERNLHTLGLDPRDIKIILNSQAHFDHAGGFAELKRRTGAQLYISAGDKQQIEDGGRSDPAFGARFPFEPAHVDHVVRDGETVTLGTTTLTAHLTPGHTRGCTTWTMTVREGGHSYSVVFLGGLTSPGYQLAGNTVYPTIVDDFKHSFATVRALPCDIFLGAHGGYFGLTEKRARMGNGKGNPFIDPGALARYVDVIERSFDEELAAQRKRAS